MTVADDLRVLIVDDEELSRSLLSSIVGEAAGYVVADVKRNGREAIESLQRESFDIIFLDIQMPGLTGALKPIVCQPLFLLLRLTSLLAVLSIFMQLTMS